MRLFALALALALGLSCAFAPALSAQPRWTLARVLERSLERAPDVQRARAELGIAEAHHAYGQVPWVGNPVLTARAMVGVPDDRAAIYALLVGLPFDFSGRQSLRLDEADALVDTGAAALGAAQNEAWSRAALAYVDVVTADALREQRQGRVQLAEDLLARTQTLVAAGAATQVDLSLIEAELGDARASLRGAEAEAARSRAALRALLDLDADDAVEVERLEPPVSPAGAVAAWRARAREQRAEPRAFAARRARLRITEDRLFAEVVDPLLFGLEWESQGNSQTAHTMGVSLSTTLPIVRTAQGERAVTRSERELALVEQGIAERSVEREVVAAAARLEAHLGELEALGTAAVPAMERAREGTLVQLERGATDLFRVIGTQRQLVSTRERRVEVLRAAWQARVELDRAMGERGATIVGPIGGGS
jgi:outer membrane protein TolC